MRHLATQPPNAICVFACFQVDILPQHHLPSFAGSSLPLSVMTSCRLLDASVSCMMCHHVDLKVSMMWFTCLQLFAATMLCLTSKQIAASISVLSRRPGQYNVCLPGNLLNCKPYFGIYFASCDPFQNCTVPWWLDLMHSNSWLAACLMITVSWRVACLITEKALTVRNSVWAATIRRWPCLLVAFVFFQFVGCFYWIASKLVPKKDWGPIF